MSDIEQKILKRMQHRKIRYVGLREYMLDEEDLKIQKKQRQEVLSKKEIIFSEIIKLNLKDFGRILKVTPSDVLIPALKNEDPYITKMFCACMSQQVAKNFLQAVRTSNATTQETKLAQEKVIDIIKNLISNNEIY